MKKSFIILFLVASINLFCQEYEIAWQKDIGGTYAQFSKDSGWIKMPKYLELKAHNNFANLIKITNDGKKIYSISNNEFKVWDFETGNLLDQHKYSFTSQYAILSDLSADDSTVIVFSDNRSTAYGSFYIITVEIFNVRDYSLIKKIDIFKTVEKDGLLGFYLKSCSSDFDYFTNTLYAGFKYYWGGNSGKSSSEAIKGGLYKFGLFKDTIINTIIHQNPSTQFAFTKNKNKIIYSSDSFEWTRELPDPVNVTHKSILASFDISNKNSHIYNLINFKNHDFDSLYQLKNLEIMKNNTIISLLKYPNKLLKWDIENQIFIDSLNFPIFPIKYKYINSDSNIICTYENKIYILNSINLTILDSIQFEKSVNKCTISISPDMIHFIISFDDGIIRLFNINNFNLKPKTVDVSEPQNQNSEISISPNPASNYITIRIPTEKQSIASLQKDIQIFNIFGEKTTPSNLSGLPHLLAKEGIVKIDVSYLVPGIYFIKVGDRFEKFVKM
jgi:hypothetical protein